MLCQVAGEASRGPAAPTQPAATRCQWRHATPPRCDGCRGPPHLRAPRREPHGSNSYAAALRTAPRSSYPQDAQSAVEMLIIQRSQIAAISSLGTLAACPERPYILSCAEHGAGVGRSNTGRLYGAARKGRSGKSVGVVDETATDSATFFGPPHTVLEAPAAKPPPPSGDSRPPKAAGGARGSPL